MPRNFRFFVVRILSLLCVFLGLLFKTLTQQRNDMEFDDLEERLRNLTTKEIEDGADNLLIDVAGLTLN